MTTRFNFLIRVLLFILITTACAGRVNEEGQAPSSDAEMLTLPKLTAVDLADNLVKVVATTGIIGDVVAQVGGDAIELTILMAPGQDPHSYELTAQDLTAVATAHVIFINGWNLEETIVRNLQAVQNTVPIVPISAKIRPLRLSSENADHDDESPAAPEQHGIADPHVWFDVNNVVQWVKNVEEVLAALDPANAETYHANASAYLDALHDLAAYAEVQMAQIPEERRFIVTNHDSFRYLADAYGFEIIGTIIPNVSTLAEPSANDLAGLISRMDEYGLCTIFTESSVNDTLAKTVADELNRCEQVRIIPLLTGSVGFDEGGNGSYIGMFRANIDAIVTGLQP